MAVDPGGGSGTATSPPAKNPTKTSKPSLSGSLLSGPYKVVTENAVAAGFRDNKLILAIARGLAESSGNPRAVSHTGCCFGLWQINYEVWKETYSLISKDVLFNPRFNADLAFKISKGGTDWSDWKASDHLVGKYMTRAAQIVAHLNSNDIAKMIEENPVGGALIDVGEGIDNAIEAVTNPLDSISGFLTTLSDRQTWIRVLMVVGGMAGVAIGISLLAKDLAVSANPISQIVTKAGGK